MFPVGPNHSRLQRQNRKKKGSLQKEWTAKGVVWLTVISSAPGTQGFVTPSQENDYLKTMNAAPEFEDCRKAAQQHDVAVKEVMGAAIAAWRSV